VAPGRLSVSRTFGDIEAKHPDLGGMQGVVVCDPDISVFKNGTNELDFLVFGSDGIFDKLKTEDIGTIVWNIIRENQYNTAMSLHQLCGRCADEILKEAAKNKTMDNISIVMMGFKKLQDLLDRSRYANVPQEPVTYNLNDSSVPDLIKSWSENKS
jgi:protein phosphatase 2C family protein 2/3